ncbi:HNH endonuclease [Actinomycetaceae bacterium WB03_NA08]|uniref:HNH endonuclease n=1 Tax=Scrofimicrobium canadense TaxID=2652290 RepID=A0A6N7VU76_9ACTO|nr:HNH endonuclease signature motif containing protein [Scrofimicrobium canadense]MSS85329.1 HNH endonuclease [Scrofimicrobium canadense]
MRYQIECDWCGLTMERTPSGIKKHNFCSRKCQGHFSSKSRNPERYGEMYDVEKASAWMGELNRKLNPTRMTANTRAKLREAHLGSGEGKSYAKIYGRYEHRVVAEAELGRALQPGEIVHHIDCNKRNNHPDNLMVLTQSEHAALHAWLNKFFGLPGVGS